MERALSFELVQLAIGERDRLPSAEELQEILVDVELQLFFGGTDIDDTLVETAWYLHAVAAADEAADVFPTERQRAAFQLSAHIFDLTSQVHLTDLERGRNDDRPVAQKLLLAAQIGYLRGGLHPNATAIGRHLAELRPDTPFEIAPTTYALTATMSLLAMDKSGVFEVSSSVRRQVTDFFGTSEADAVSRSPLGPAWHVVEACRELIIYLSYADAHPRLETGSQHLRQALGSVPNLIDVDSQWAAAHLQDLARDWSRSSIWAALPPEIPVQAGEAMTSSDPPVLTLWPPQQRLLAGDPNPLLPSTRRLVLSLPTSSGKSLVAQLIAVSHLASGQGAICYVAPTHSLVREVRRSLRSRVRALGRRLANAEPDWGPVEDRPYADVDVMTPERLSLMIRSDPVGTLTRFGLFIIDEAHLLDEKGRGWGLEGSLSFLHSQTLDSHHRIALLSAAIGNRSQIASWITTDLSPTREFHDEWRGPRRINAIFTTDVDWDSRTEIEAAGGRRLARATYDLKGKIYVRVPGGGIKRASFDQPVGLRTRLIDSGVERQGRGSFYPAESTPFYQSLSPLIVHLAEAGPVLVVESTRDSASRLAAHVARELPTFPAAEPLVNLARQRLDQDHPLTTILQSGVAYHHAGLPRDLQDAIESGMRNGQIRILVSTTTLTEGVNLPVRSVVIASQGTGSDAPYIVGPRLLNAIGRAGRAGKETEGWVVLAHNGEFAGSLFEQFDRDDASLQVKSQLSAPEAVELLASYEQALRESEDAVFELASNVATDFMAYIWMLATNLQVAASPVGFDVVMSVVERTLAWEQADAGHRQNLRDVSVHAFNAFWQTPTAQRRRWARSGTSIGSSRRLQVLADQYMDWIGQASDLNLQAPIEIIESLIQSGVISAMLELPEAEDVRRSWPTTYRNAGQRGAIDLDVGAMLMDWVEGASLKSLSERHLTAITDTTFRSERLSIFLSSTFENYLPWMLGLLVSWTNETLAKLDVDQIPPDVVGFIEWGVGSEHARLLMAGGVRSRTAATRIANPAIELELEPSDVATWLGSIPVSELVDRFQLSYPELEDVLTFAGVTANPALSQLLSGESWTIPLEASTTLAVDSELAFIAVDDYPNVSIQIVEVATGREIAQVPTSFVSGVRDVLQSGLPYVATALEDLPEHGVRVIFVEASAL